MHVSGYWKGSHNRLYVVFEVSHGIIGLASSVTSTQTNGASIEVLA